MTEEGGGTRWDNCSWEVVMVLPPITLHPKCFMSRNVSLQDITGPSFEGLDCLSLRRCQPSFDLVRDNGVIKKGVNSLMIHINDHPQFIQMVQYVFISCRGEI